MAEKSTNNTAINTSDQSTSDPHFSSKGEQEKYIRGHFEALLDESTTDEEDTEEAEVSSCLNTENKKIGDSTETPNARNQSSVTEEDPDEIILSLISVKGQLGAAYYNVITSELFVMDDVVEDDSNHGIIKALYRQSQPRYVVTSTGTSDLFLDVVKKLIINDTINTNDSLSMASGISAPIRVSLKLMPKKEYSFDNCYHRVKCLKLNCEPSNASVAERMIFLNSLINFKSRMMIFALGLLLKYIDVNWNNITLDPSGHAQFIHINYIMLKDLVMIDEDTYKALSIVQSRFHPSLFKFGNIASKDKGVSLFALLNRCESRPGVQYLWKLLRHPTRDIKILKKRFQVIQFFLDSNNQNVVENLKLCLRQVYRLTTNIMNRYAAPQAKVADWNKLHKTLRRLISIGDICADFREASSLFANIADSITSEMHIVRYFIDYIVDFDMSRIQGKFVVKPGVDPDLDELNKTREKLPQLLTEMAEKDMKNHPHLMEGCRMIYLPDIRYVLAITVWDGAPPEEDEIPGLEFKFTINGVRHYKSDGARELDETVGDVLLKITNRQSHIMLRLVRYISKHIGPILKAIEYCAELDTLLSFALVARDHNYVMPTLVEEQIIEIKRGRHPIRELSMTFVPNDTFSGTGKSLVKILTGPNACGKSIYLKQIALIVFMAHIGSFVPAESATIGIVTHILTQIMSIESLAQNASSFLLDLRQINTILFASTPNSLVIIDEFGKGTTEIDGLALLASVLNSFLERGIYCPHIFAATHIHRVLEFLPRNSSVEAQTFEFVSNEDNSLAFLYRLIPGSLGNSFAHSVAKSAGLDSQVVERAIEIFKCKKRGILPTAVSTGNQQNTLRHIMELLSTANGKVDVEGLKLWVRQAMAKPTKK